MVEQGIVGGRAGLLLRVFWFVVALSVALFGQVGDEASTSPFGESLEALAAPLEELAAWCLKEGLLREHERVLSALCVVRPEVEASRKALGYARTSDGRWERSSAWQPSKKTRGRLLKEFRDRADPLLRTMKTRVLATLKEKPDAGTPWARREALRLLFEALPSDRELREALGETYVSGKWQLAETLRGRRRRRRLEALVSRLKDETAAVVDAPCPSWTQKISLPWSATVKSGGIVVIGAVNREEVEGAARLAAHAWATAQELLSKTTPPLEDYRIHLMTEAGRDVYLREHPRMTAERAKFLRSLRCGWCPFTWDVGIWHPTEVGRREWVARQTINAFLQRDFDLKLRHDGAIMEGIGLYVSHLVTGLRASWFVNPSGYDTQSTGLGQRLLDPEVEWLDEARRRYAKGHRLDSRGLFGKGVEAMTPSDLLDGYVVAAWFLEGETEGLASLLTDLGRGSHHVEALPRNLGYTTREFDERIMRWVSERQP